MLLQFTARCTADATAEQQMIICKHFSRLFEKQNNVAAFKYGFYIST
jgi:hypothetical protein